MGLIVQYIQDKFVKEKMMWVQFINFFSFSVNLLDECDDIMDYINQLDFSKGKIEQEIWIGYQQFKVEKLEKDLLVIVMKYGLEVDCFSVFVENVMDCMVFDGEKLSDLLVLLELGWKDCICKELVFMEELVFLLKKCV